MPKPAVFAFFVILAVLVPVFTAQTDNDIYFLRVCTIALVFALLALGLNVAVGFAGLLDLGYIAYYGIGAYGYAMLSSDKYGIHWEAWLVDPARGRRSPRCSDSSSRFRRGGSSATTSRS